MTLDPRRRLLYGGLLALALATLWATQRLAPVVRAGRALDGREAALAQDAGGPLPDAAALEDEVDRLRAALDARAAAGAPGAGRPARAPADRVMEAELALSDLAHAVGLRVEAFERADAPARPTAAVDALDDGGAPPAAAPRAAAHTLAALPPAPPAGPPARGAQPGPASAPGEPERPAARLVLRGDFFALRDLLDGLGGLPWAIAVERLDVTAEPDGRGGSTLRVELRVRA